MTKTIDEKRDEFIDIFEEEPRTLLLTRIELRGLCEIYHGAAAKSMKSKGGFDFRWFDEMLATYEKRGIDPTQAEAEEFGSG